MGKLFVLVFVSIFYYTFPVNGQNFAAGNPFLSDAEQSTLQEKELLFSFTYHNAFSTQYFKEDHINHDQNNIKKAYSNYTEFKTAYGFSPKFSASFELGYFLNKTLAYENTSQKGFGLGDAAVYLKYRLIYSKYAKFTLLPAVGIKLPIGVFGQTDGKVNLPLALQPSSGNFKYIVSVYMSKIMNEKLVIASLCSYENAQLIDTRNFYFKYGDQWMLAFYADYKFSNSISADMQFRFENKDKSHITFSKIIEASGCKIVFITPQFSYHFNRNWEISVYADLPVYRYYNGIQFAEGYSFSLKVMKKLEL